MGGGEVSNFYRAGDGPSRQSRIAYAGPPRLSIFARAKNKAVLSATARYKRGDSRKYVSIDDRRIDETLSKINEAHERIDIAISLAKFRDTRRDVRYSVGHPSFIVPRKNIVARNTAR